MVKMFFKNALLALLLAITGCVEEQDMCQKNPNDLSKDCQDPYQVGTGSSSQNAENRPEVDTSFGDSPNSGFDGQQLQQEKLVFRDFCVSAAKIPLMNDKLKNNFANLCVGDLPTKLLTTTLVEKAYNGANNVSVTDIEPPQALEGNLTRMVVGMAIEIPISIENHFNNVAPLNGNPEILTAAAQKQGATATVEILETYNKREESHVRGWKIYTSAEKPAAEGIDFKIQTVNTAINDQWQLKENNIYMYTSYFTEDGEGVIKTDMLTVGIKYLGKSYLINVTEVIADHKISLFHQTAINEIRSTAESIARNMHDLAASKQPN